MTLKQNIFAAAGRSIAVDIVGDVLYFPIWWYTSGLKYRLKRFMQSIGEMADHLALRLLLLNIFKPMFAQYDRTGRIISFFMRIVILIVRSVYFFIYSIVQMVIVVVWLLLPVLIVSRILEIYLLRYVTG
ncbi:MAG: hypothetical protein HY422_01030 [Candidatus Komeilibacteria bacterium]|nr:hypothetical protein [Candidatus Komeilibacteria bacterium]